MTAFVQRVVNSDPIAFITNNLHVITTAGLHQLIFIHLALLTVASPAMLHADEGLKHSDFFSNS